MRKCLALILIVAFGIITNSCKKNETPTNPDKPLTLAERAGTYKGKSSSTTVVITIGVKSDGSGTLQWNTQTPSNCQIVQLIEKIIFSVFLVFFRWRY